MLRLEPDDAQNLNDAAHLARLPVAVFARELILNRMPKMAPPLPVNLPFEARELLRVIHASASNLSQLDAYAQAAGEPLSRLSGPAGLLFKLGSRVREIGLLVKSGQLDRQKTAELLARFETPSRALNDRLARPLNEAQKAQVAGPSREVWREVLQSVQAALLTDVSEAPNGRV